MILEKEISLTSLNENFDDLEMKESTLTQDIEGNTNSNLLTSIIQSNAGDTKLPIESEIIPHNSPALTIFLLINTMIGSGILNQPAVFSNSGIFGGIFGYILASVMVWFGLNILTAAGLKTEKYEYGELSKFVLGRKGEILIDVSIVIFCFGALLGYILVVGSTFSGLLNSWGCASTGCGFYSVTIICVALFVCPICLFRHFGHLAWISVFSVFAIVLVLGLVIIGGPIESISGPITYFNPLGTITSLGSIIFSLSCASANFQAYITTVESSQNRKSWMSITGWVVFIGSLMCVIMGVAGYLSFKSSTDGIILDNFIGAQFDFFKVMVSVHLIFYIPVNFVIFRYSFLKLSLNKKSEELQLPLHVIVTLSLLTFVTLFLFFLNSLGFTSGEAFSIILNITGGISGSITSFILPSWIFLTLPDTKNDFLYYPAWIILILGICIMFGVVIISITSNL